MDDRLKRKKAALKRARNVPPPSCGQGSAMGWKCDLPRGHEGAADGRHSSAGDGFHHGGPLSPLCPGCRAVDGQGRPTACQSGCPITYAKPALKKKVKRSADSAAFRTLAQPQRDAVAQPKPQVPEVEEDEPEEAPAPPKKPRRPLTPDEEDAVAWYLRKLHPDWPESYLPEWARDKGK